MTATACSGATRQWSDSVLAINDHAFNGVNDLATNGKDERMQKTIGRDMHCVLGPIGKFVDQVAVSL